MQLIRNRALEKRKNQYRRIHTGGHHRTFAALVISAAFFTAAAQVGFADNREDTGLLPSSQPFTLSLYDARMAKAMLERVGLVQVERGSDSSRNVKVKAVRIVYVGKDADLPEPHHLRFDLELNGGSLDWNNTYIKYDSKMMNMRALFTYRNQRPVPEGPYHLNEHSHSP
ncbi:MAG: hypothetical protein R6V67_03440 [Spirochaetia bacterium]